jgi:hypothetical protein
MSSGEEEGRVLSWRCVMRLDAASAGRESWVCGCGVGSTLRVLPVFGLDVRGAHVPVSGCTVGLRRWLGRVIEVPGLGLREARVVMGLGRHVVRGRPLTPRKAWATRLASMESGCWSY